MGTPLFGVVTGPHLIDVEALLSSEKSQIDGIELRLDAFKAVDLAALKAFIQNSALPVMLTLRRKDQGGMFEGTENERLTLLERLCALQPAYLDLEYDVPLDFRRQLFERHPQVQILSSYHNFEETPLDLEELLTRVRTPYAHIIKIAVTARSMLDTLRMLSFLQLHNASIKIIGISMGKEGSLTRILAPLVGNCLTYAPLMAEGATAPGQLLARELQETYRFRTLNRNTAIYALIGDPVERSLGALIHNAVFQEGQIDAVYVKIPLKKGELDSFFQWIQSFPVRGLSVTMPHKENVIPFLDTRSKEVQEMGACNTIKIEKGKLLGFNTDGVGALNAIERVEGVREKRLVIIGAGGAAKAIIYEALQRGAHVTILNRSAEKAQELAHLYQCRGGGFDLFPTVVRERYDILINCIPDGDLIDGEWILPNSIAMDIVYLPKETPFLRRALEKNCRLIFGYEMFVHQAVEQQHIWFPDTIDIERCHSTIEQKVLRTISL